MLILQAKIFDDADELNGIIRCPDVGRHKPLFWSARSILLFNQGIET